MQLATAFVMGVVFAVGLVVGGMTRPAKVIGFLDVTGNWDPTLLFVMAGAVAVTTVLFPRILRRPAPVLCARFVVPARARVDARLLLGSALFGVGWGLSGYCPGPAIVSVTTGAPAAVVFALSMLAGLHLGGRVLESVAGVTAYRLQQPLARGGGDRKRGGRVRAILDGAIPGDDG